MQVPRKLILSNYQSPGDLVMLTAAVRDLHLSYPKRFVTDVESSCPDLWQHNRYLSELDAGDPRVEVIECHYPLVKKSNRAPRHFVEGFIAHLNEVLDLSIELSMFGGDIHLSMEEEASDGPVAAIFGRKLPYWLVDAGGKYDVTIKWWHRDRYQRVIDHFRDRLLFVQIGREGHFHPRLDGALDLRGRTSIRDTILLMRRASGVLCSVTFLMHLAAAVSTDSGSPLNRPCVVVAGGREAPHWEAYPSHAFLHTVGRLSCCCTGGCWKARTLPLGDGSKFDSESSLCTQPVGDLPRCMDMITPAQAIEAIENYLAGKRSPVLTREEASFLNQSGRLSRDPIDSALEKNGLSWLLESVS